MPIENISTFPLAIGGGGGSGTRLVAELIQKCGFYIGSDLNKSLDNLWFTLLFRRPRWFLNHSNDQDVYSLFDLFFDVMQGQFKAGFVHMSRLFKAALDFWLHESRRKKSIHWLGVRLRSLVHYGKMNPVMQGFNGWGWKEPNTHIFLPYLIQYCDDLRYIHVIRHGLDMAYSQNQNQLYDWHTHFGLTLPESADDLPNASLKYWVCSNQLALETGQAKLGERFYLLNYDDLCLRPLEETEKLLSWLGLPKTNLNELASLVKMPSSYQRYKKHDLANFDQQDIETVVKMGFQVDA